jgi:hypothetical protein
MGEVGYVEEFAGGREEEEVVNYSCCCFDI